MTLNAKLEELNAILETLNQRLSTVQSDGDYTAAFRLEETIQKLKVYIEEKEKTLNAVK